MAQWTGKVVGGLLGALAFGPFGIPLGVLVGHQFDAKFGSSDDEDAAFARADAATIGEQFFTSTFRVMGHVAKADGRVSEREIAAARRVMSELRLDDTRIRMAIGHFTDGKQPDFALAAELKRLRRVCAGRPDLLRVFMEIQMRAGLVGSDLEHAARSVLRRIAGELDISGLELAHIEAIARVRSGAFRSEPAGRPSQTKVTEAYSVLETEPTASDADVVKAYRRQLSRHHPDKLKANGLPESMIEYAKQRTQQIIEAYELIRERRGMT